MDSNAPSMLKATLIGGAALGVAAAIPFVNMLNACCCLLVVAAGFFAAYLYSNECKAKGAPFGAGGGATVGLVAGMFYALSTTIVGGAINLALGFDPEELVAQLEQAGVKVPPEAEPWIDFITTASPLTLLTLAFFFNLLVAAIFSTIGGLIGGAVFKVERATSPPPVPPVGT
jgi:hypothetical protein